MGLRGIPETEVLFEDMEVAADRGPHAPARLWPGVRGSDERLQLAAGRAAAVALGIADGACRHALAYVGEREQFGRPLAEFQGLQWMLAGHEHPGRGPARLMIHKAAAGAAPVPDVTLAAQAKIFASDMAIRVANDALQCFGARGYSRNLPLERMARDAPDVHHRRGDRADSAHGGGVADPGAQAAADAGRIQPAGGKGVEARVSPPATTSTRTKVDFVLFFCFPFGEPEEQQKWIPFGEFSARP